MDGGTRNGRLEIPFVSSFDYNLDHRSFNYREIGALKFSDPVETEVFVTLQFRINSYYSAWDDGRGVFFTQFNRGITRETGRRMLKDTCLVLFTGYIRRSFISRISSPPRVTRRVSRIRVCTARRLCNGAAAARRRRRCY